MNQSVYQHYGKEERAFIDQVFSWMQEVENRYSPYLTEFLTPREVMIVQQLVTSHDDLGLQTSGGYDRAERQRAFIYPSYYQVEVSDFQIVLLKVKFPSKFADISHGKILGTLLATGIERGRIGDIVTDGQGWQCLVDQGMATYLINQVTKIGNVGVHLEKLDLDDILESQEEWENETVISTSLRLDNLISKVYKISRQRAKDAISSGLVKVNFMTMDRSDYELKVNDIVSMRKKGRFWIKSLDGMTKKENYRLNIDILKV